jgi:hypothetical protein
MTDKNQEENNIIHHTAEDYRKHCEHKKLNAKPASETIKELTLINEEGSTTVEDIVKVFQENGLLLSLLFFSLPIAIPIPYPPGFTTLVGIPLMMISFQMLLGYEEVRLPQILSQYSISNQNLKVICLKLYPIIEKIEFYLKQRYSFATSVKAEQFIGFVSLIDAIFIAIPLPATNLVPAIGITIMSLGLLRRDGLVVIIGTIISIIGILIAAAVCASVIFAAKFLLFSL